MDFTEFDTAKLDDKVNAYISPRIHNIISKTNSNFVEILIPNSIKEKPYIFKKDGAYENPNLPPQQKFEFYEGQIWVRHSGKNEKATKDDFDRMFKEKLDEFLKSINLIAAQFPISSKDVEKIFQNSESATIKGKGLPVLLEKIDPNVGYPHTAKTLGSLVGKNQNFIAKATQVLGLKDDLKYAIKIKNPKGVVVMTKYSNDTLDFLRKHL